MSQITVRFLDAKKNVRLELNGIPRSLTIQSLKEKAAPALKIDLARFALRFEARGPLLKDGVEMNALLKDGQSLDLYIKDLGPQISWKGVFLAEYAGPLFVYWLFAARPAFIYGGQTGATSMTRPAQAALAFWSIHYAKRLFETLFVHRFSNATMPLGNLFKNCSYYWGFAAFVAYYVNHPLFTPAPTFMYNAGMILFMFGEFGNLSVHLALRNLRPAGTKVRKIPQPVASSPLTNLFRYVSCPNYTYEFMSWVGFSLMTCCVPAWLFTAAGMYQMTVWAIGKHKNYRKEFPDYPKNRKAIIPFLI